MQCVHPCVPESRYHHQIFVNSQSFSRNETLGLTFCCLRIFFWPIQGKGKKSSNTTQLENHRLSIAARWMALASCSCPSGRQRWATSHATSSEAWRQNAKAKGTPQTPGLLGGKHPRFFWRLNSELVTPKKLQKLANQLFWITLLITFMLDLSIFSTCRDTVFSKNAQHLKKPSKKHSTIKASFGNW